MLTVVFHIPMLLNHGVFWDDWTLYNMDFDGLKEQYMNNGSHYYGITHLHHFIGSLPNPIAVYRILLLSILIAINTLFYASITGLKMLEGKKALMLSVLFVVAPFCFAKICLINLIYQIMFLFFMAGTWLLSLYLQTRKPLFRILSLTFYLYSFATNSILLLYGAILVLLFLRHIQSKRISFQNILHFMRYHADFVFIPLVFIALRYTFLKPSGYYAVQGYNQIQPEHLKHLPLEIFQVFYHNTLDLLKMIFQANNHLVVVLATALWIFFLILLGFRYPGRIAPLFLNNNKKALGILATGIFLLILAVTPYLLVGKAPVFRGFDTRHQLLMPLGFSFTVFALISLTPFGKGKCVLCGMVILFCSEVQLTQHVRYLKGWLKQEAIMANIPGLLHRHALNTVELIDDLSDATLQKLTWRIMNTQECSRKLPVRRINVFSRPTCWVPSSIKACASLHLSGNGNRNIILNQTICWILNRVATVCF